MTRIAHLSDLHFGATDPAVVTALLAALHADPPDIVVISGDLTQGARRQEFRAARHFIDACRAPVLCVPGNHDITPYRLRERFLDPYRRWREEIAPETEPAWQDTTVAIQGLNTTRRGGLYLDWSRGRISTHRLQSAIARLDARPAALIRIVVVHHPLLPPEGAPATRVAGGAARALAVFASHNVALVLAGHLHRSYSRASPTNPLVLQGGSATSTRLRGEPNMFRRLTIDPNGQTQIDPHQWTGTAWTRGPTMSTVL